MRPPKPVDQDDLFRYSELVQRTLAGNIDYGTPTDSGAQNIKGAWAVVANTGAANAQFTVTHNLGYVPVAFDVKRINLAGTVYDSGVAWTTTQIFLKCSVANAAVTLFIH